LQLQKVVSNLIAAGDSVAPVTVLAENPDAESWLIRMPRSRKVETPLPAGVRPKFFGLLELYLDLTHIVRGDGSLDLESVLIMVCAAEATMHPLILSQSTPPAARKMSNPPEEYRGSISRSLLAERTGLPRETVRRKVATLVATGRLIEDGSRRIRTPANLDRKRLQKLGEAAFVAVERYRARVQALLKEEEAGL